MPSIHTRLDRLERSHGDAADRLAQVHADAEFVMTKLGAIASSFPDNARLVSVATREGWSPAQQIAWDMRFASKAEATA